MNVGHLSFAENSNISCHISYSTNPLFLKERTIM